MGTKTRNRLNSVMDPGIPPRCTAQDKQKGQGVPLLGTKVFPKQQQGPEGSDSEGLPSMHYNPGFHPQALHKARCNAVCPQLQHLGDEGRNTRISRSS